MKIEKEISSIMTEIFETEFSEDSKQLAVYIAGYVSNFSCEQLFKKSKSMSVQTIINIFYNKQKITNKGVRDEQIRDFKKRQLEKR